MVDRIIAKLGEIVTSMQTGLRVSSHLEVTQMLRDAYDTVMEEHEAATPGTGNKGFVRTYGCSTR